MTTLLRSRAEIIHTLCLSESAIAALSSVNVPRHASLLRLALTNSSFAFCMNNFCTAPYVTAVWTSASGNNLRFPGR